RLAAPGGQRLLAIGGDRHLVALLHQVLREHLGEAGLVLDDENGGRRPRHRRWQRRHADLPAARRTGAPLAPGTACAAASSGSVTVKRVPARPSGRGWHTTRPPISSTLLLTR